jgi:hypothetical protein
MYNPNQIVIFLKRLIIKGSIIKKEEEDDENDNDIFYSWFKYTQYKNF